MGKNKNYDSAKKVQVLKDMIRGQKTIEEICIKHGIGASTAYKWKKIFDKNIHLIFEVTQKPQKTKPSESPDYLKKIIGNITVENEILKKALSVWG